MAAFLDGCRFNPTAGGTTDWTYSSVVPGYQNPAAAGVVNGRLYKYRAESADLSQWELGEGAYNTGTGTLARTTVLFNSSGTTSKVSFSSVPQVAIVALKEDLLSVEEANSFSTTQQAQARVNIEGAPFDALAYNNIIINGGMLIDQVNAGASINPATALFSADMWVVGSIGTMVCAIQQVSDAPPGFSKSLKVTVSTAEASLGSGDYLQIQQRIEGYRTARCGFGATGAQSVTLGFWTKIHRTGVYSGSLRNDGATRSYPFAFTQNVADTWEYKTITIPGDVTGTWGATNSPDWHVFIMPAVGSTFQAASGAWAAGNFLGATGTTNGVAATTDVFQLTGVSLMPGTDVGSSARSPNLQLPFAETLQLCQRYFWKTFAYSTAPAQNVSANALQLDCLTAGISGWCINYPVRMRAAPTVVTYNPSAANSSVRDTTNSADRAVSAGTFNCESGVFLEFVALAPACRNFVHVTADARF